MPSPSEDAWPPTLIEDSPYGIISRKIVEFMMDEPAYQLYVSGHRYYLLLRSTLCAGLACKLHISGHRCILCRGVKTSVAVHVCLGHDTQHSGKTKRGDWQQWAGHPGILLQ